MTLDLLRRPSGAFAMLAVDQREALRQMMAAHRSGTVTDADLARFKLAATRILSPFASGVLVDKQFALDEVIEAGAVAPQSQLIATADRFHEAHGELVGEVDLDPDVDAHEYAAKGVVALKLLVLYRPGTPTQPRIDLTSTFIERCRNAGLASIIEPVSRKPLDERTWDWNEGVLAAAEELGHLGADLYKAEMPLRGEASSERLLEECRRLTRAIGSPWVVLSSGVREENFENAVSIACQGGASGFLAGRAVWASCLAAANVEACLAGPARARLEAYGRAADEATAMAVPADSRPDH